MHRVQTVSVLREWQSVFILQGKTESRVAAAYSLRQSCQAPSGATGRVGLRWSSGLKVARAIACSGPKGDQRRVASGSY